MHGCFTECFSSLIDKLSEFFSIHQTRSGCIASLGSACDRDDVGFFAEIFIQMRNTLLIIIDQACGAEHSADRFPVHIPLILVRHVWLLLRRMNGLRIHLSGVYPDHGIRHPVVQHGRGDDDLF